MWQALQEDLKSHAFKVVPVAQESRGAETARPWVEQAKATYPTLVDREHQVSGLYGMVNVPEAVWIDEHGVIVRPAEVAGSTEHFRRMNRETRELAPEAVAARGAARRLYLDAVRDWVRSGRHALAPDAARARQPAITAEVALARAHFRLGVWLHERGRVAERDRQFQRASELHPDSWCIWRQAADLEKIGNAAGPAFWARVDALAEKRYYPPPDIPGFPR